MGRNPTRFILTCVFYTAITAPRSARAADEPHLRLGLIPVLNKSIEKNLVYWVGDRIMTAALAAHVEIVRGQVITQKLGATPLQLFDQCGPNIKCVAGIGTKGGVDLILFARWVQIADGAAQLQYLLIDSRNETLHSKGRVTVAKSTPTGGPIPELDHLFDKLVAPPSAPPPPPPAVATLPPSAPPPLSPDALPPVPKKLPTATKTLEPLAAAPSQRIPAQVHVTGRATWPALRTVYVAAAGVGLCVLVAGLVVKSQAASQVERIRYGIGGTAQLEAIRVGQDASSLSGVGNVLMLSGSLVSVAAAGLLAADWLGFWSVGASREDTNTSYTLGVAWPM